MRSIIRGLAPVRVLSPAYEGGFSSDDSDGVQSLTDGDLDRPVPTFKINGADRNLTLREVMAMASKATGSEERLRQATEKESRSKAESEELARIKGALKKLPNNDPEAFALVMNAAGVDALTAERLWSEFTGRSGGEGEGSSRGNGTSGGRSSGGRISYDQLPDEVLEAAQFIAECRKQGINPLNALRRGDLAGELLSEDRGKEALRDAIDKFPVLAKIGRRSRDSRTQLINTVWTDLSGRLRAGARYPDVLQQTLQHWSDVLALAQDAKPDEGNANPPLGMVAFGQGGSGGSIYPADQHPPALDLRKLREPGVLASHIDRSLAYSRANASERADGSPTLD